MLVLTVSVQATHGAPSRAIAELHAAKCCAHVCHHPHNAGAARRCCQVAQDDPGVVVAANELRAPMLLSLPVDVVSAHLGPSSGDVLRDVEAPRGRAAPLFLLSRTLRL